MDIYRIESVHPSVVEAVMQLNELIVNNVTFRPYGSRVISDPVDEAVPRCFYGSRDFRLVRVEEPFEHVSDLGNEQGFLDVSSGLDGVPLEDDFDLGLSSSESEAFEKAMLVLLEKPEQFLDYPAKLKEAQSQIASTLLLDSITDEYRQKLEEAQSAIGLKLEPAPEVKTWESLTNAMLRELAEANNVTAPKAAKKDDLIALLKAANVELPTDTEDNLGE